MNLKACAWQSYSPARLPNGPVPPPPHWRGRSHSRYNPPAAPPCDPHTSPESCTSPVSPSLSACGAEKRPCTPEPSTSAEGPLPIYPLRNRDTYRESHSGPNRQEPATTRIPISNAPLPGRRTFPDSHKALLRRKSRGRPRKPRNRGAEAAGQSPLHPRKAPVRKECRSAPARMAPDKGNGTTMASTFSHTNARKSPSCSPTRYNRAPRPAFPTPAAPGITEWPGNRRSRSRTAVSLVHPIQQHSLPSSSCHDESCRSAGLSLAPRAAVPPYRPLPAPSGQQQKEKRRRSRPGDIPGAQLVHDELGRIIADEEYRDYVDANALQPRRENIERHTCRCQ